MARWGAMRGPVADDDAASDRAAMDVICTTGGVLSTRTMCQLRMIFENVGFF
jgi:hypothetical protein